MKSFTAFYRNASSVSNRSDAAAGVNRSIMADFINLRLKLLKGSSSTENKVITNALERCSATRIKIETCSRCV
jgi:hypothetical protein